MNKTALLLFPLLIITFLSCNKNKQAPESEPVVPQEEKCLVTSISGNVGYGQSFTYDEQGRVILTTGRYFGTYSYSYSKDQIITNTGSSIQTYTLDQKGRIITVVDSRSKRDYIYNADGYLINMNYYDVSTGSQPVLNPGLSASYTYTDGNLTLIEQDSGNTKTTVEYNTLIAKDPFFTQMRNLPFPSTTIAPMLVRYLGKQSKNLFDSSKNYVIDEKGNVKTAYQLVAGISSGPANFGYNCK